MKPTKSSLTRKLDKICSDIIRLNPCCRCGQRDRDKIQCAHIFSRVFRSVRWSLLNLIPLCASCHFWAHRNPILFTEFVQKYLGEEDYENLKKVAMPIHKWSLGGMLLLYDELKQKYQDTLVWADIKNESM